MLSAWLYHKLEECCGNCYREGGVCLISGRGGKVGQAYAARDNVDMLSSSCRTHRTSVLCNPGMAEVSWNKNEPPHLGIGPKLRRCNYASPHEIRSK